GYCPLVDERGGGNHRCRCGYPQGCRTLCHPPPSAPAGYRAGPVGRADQSGGSAAGTEELQRPRRPPTITTAAATQGGVPFMISSQQLGGADGRVISQPLSMCNRHGLIAGATGTGMTVTLQVLAEGFARAGVTVIAADIKGDLFGVAAAAAPSAGIDKRRALMPGLEWQPESVPVVFWDILGDRGHPLRTTISEMGPLLLASLLGLNDSQLAARYGVCSGADPPGVLRRDLKDRQAMWDWLLSAPANLAAVRGGISPASIQAIQRRMVILQQQGAERL